MEERKTNKYLPYILIAGRGIMAGVVAAMMTAVFAWALCDLFGKPISLSAVLISLALFVPGHLMWDGDAENEGQQVAYILMVVLSLFVGIASLMNPVVNFLNDMVKLF